MELNWNSLQMLGNFLISGARLTFFQTSYQRLLQHWSPLFNKLSVVRVGQIENLKNGFFVDIVALHERFVTAIVYAATVRTLIFACNQAFLTKSMTNIRDIIFAALKWLDDSRAVALCFSCRLSKDNLNCSRILNIQSSNEIISIFWYNLFKTFTNVFSLFCFKY